MQMYEEAITTIKFELEQAFILNDTQCEVKAYESLAICHFYLTNLRKSSYYLTRLMKGIVEPPDSEIRQAY